MKYYLSTKFHKYKKKPLFSKPIDTIELISIGIVSEDEPFNMGYNASKEYYAICKEFDLKAAWKDEWLRENVLKEIWAEYYEILKPKNNERPFVINTGTYGAKQLKKSLCYNEFTYKSLKDIINKYGKTKKQIADEIKEFVGMKYMHDGKGCDSWEFPKDSTLPEFYGYYADYDWVVFCWLFGRDLPSGFPRYCRNLKQELDGKLENKFPADRLEYRLKLAKEDKNYPKQTNALDNTRWNKELYNFIKTL